MLDTLTAPCAQDTPPAQSSDLHCEQCGEVFQPRTSSGGKPQRFCSPECRQSFHAQRRQRAPTCSAVDANSESPDQKEPTATERRATLIAGTADYLAKFPEEADGKTAEEAADDFIAKRGAKVEPDTDNGVDFSWRDTDSVVLGEQQATAIYWNPNNDLVIRQERSWDRDEDQVIIIDKANVARFVDQLTDICGIRSVGRQ